MEDLKKILKASNGNISHPYVTDWIDGNFRQIITTQKLLLEIYKKANKINEHTVALENNIEKLNEIWAYFNYCHKRYGWMVDNAKKISDWNKF